MRNNTVCVFCSSSKKIESSNFELAFRVGELIARENLSLGYGGGANGMMSSLVEGYLSLGSDNNVYSFIPKIVSDNGLSSSIGSIVSSNCLSQRKSQMLDTSDTFIVLPGGIGTIDELFHMLAQKQMYCNKKNIIIVNHNGFYDKLLSIFDDLVMAGYVKSEHCKLFKVVESSDLDSKLIEFLTGVGE